MSTGRSMTAVSLWAARRRKPVPPSVGRTMWRFGVDLKGAPDRVDNALAICGLAACRRRAPFAAGSIRVSPKSRLLLAGSALVLSGLLAAVASPWTRGPPPNPQQAIALAPIVQQLRTHSGSDPDNALFLWN